jgi:clan AA aspartic protease (TIGR02281 family)
MLSRGPEVVMETSVVRPRVIVSAGKLGTGAVQSCIFERQGRSLRRFHQCITCVQAFCAIAALLLALIGATLSIASPAQAGDFDETLESLGIMLPVSIAHMSSVRRPLEELQRERCDETAITNLGDALQKLGRRREAATAQMSFSRNCNGDAASVRRAVNILLQLNDYEEVVSTATELIKLEPYGDNGYYLRALGYDRGGNCKKAIDDYATAIELFGNKERISSVGYFGMMRCYERLEQFCDARVPIEAWIALNPARNDNSQTRMILAELSSKGNCALATAAGEEVLPLGRTGQTVTVPVSINGVPGRFILDTGATFVALKRSFAQRAKVDVDESSSIRLATANGITEARRGHAKSVALKKLAAQDVAIVVQADDRATYGDKIDGLLGMSFLSRFDMTIDAKSVRLKARNRR